MSWEATALEGAGPEQVTRLRRGFLRCLDQDSPVINGLSASEAITVGAGPLLRSEPTSALDEATTHRVIAHLRELVDSGVGILTATHDPLLIEAADTVMPLH